MGRYSVLETEEDIAWLRDVHCRDLPSNIHFAVVYGNEDAPERIEAWIDENPQYDALPDYAWSSLDIW